MLGRKPGRILHVTEALGGGVASALVAYAESTPEYEHHLLLRERSQHSTGEALDVFQTVQVLPDSLLGSVAAVRRCARKVNATIIHAHSSYAGAYVRMSPSRLPPIVYSPHCFAFERTDVSTGRAMVYRAIESVLTHRTFAFACVSPYEVELAERLGAKRARYVRNRALRVQAGSATYQLPLTVAIAGRASAQKDWKFAIKLRDLVGVHSLNIRWVWAGGGDRGAEEALRAAGFYVTGWRERLSITEILRSSQIYVHTAAWEGAPITIFEAASLGLPMVVRRLPSLSSLGVPGLCPNVERMAEHLVTLVQRDCWLAEQRASLDFASKYDARTQGAELRRIYELAS